MRLCARFLLIIALGSLTGCFATKDDLRSLQRDMDEAKGRIVTMGNDINGMKAEAREEVSRSLTLFKKELDTLRKGTADLQATLDSAQVDVQSLTGKIDDASNLSRKSSDDINLLRDDTNRRLAALEERLLKVEKSLEGYQKNRAEETEKKPEELYQEALNLFRGGDNQKSRDLFTKFVSLYPQHDLIANAHYWIGESYYNEKNYDQAVLEFQEVVKNYPGKEKAPAALLKQGMAFKALGDTKSARYVWKKLVDTYPKAEETRTAKERLKELK